MIWVVFFFLKNDNDWGGVFLPQTMTMIWVMFSNLNNGRDVWVTCFSLT